MGSLLGLPLKLAGESYFPASEVFLFLGCVTLLGLLGSLGGRPLTYQPLGFHLFSGSLVGAGVLGSPSGSPFGFPFLGLFLVSGGIGVPLLGSPFWALFSLWGSPFWFPLWLGVPFGVPFWGPLLGSLFDAFSNDCCKPLLIATPISIACIDILIH